MRFNSGFKGLSGPAALKIWEGFLVQASMQFNLRPEKESRSFLCQLLQNSIIFRIMYGISPKSANNCGGY